uniref:Bifunctional inhibitor/plant lipid transfer protein/seed storage helical domain-containing protein n=1 Tax=Triticum urartu TaxID=4572 RepID=A0A8R7UKS6_TRIUA
MERSHLHHHLLLLLLVVGVGLLATEVAGHEQESCDTAILAHHINILSPPTTEKDPGGASCEVVRSGVDSSLAAAAGVTPCLCLLDDVPAFLVTGFFIAHVPAEIYAPCGGQHVNEAQLLAEKCGSIYGPRFVVLEFTFHRAYAILNGTMPRVAQEYWLDCHPGERRRRTKMAPWRTMRTAPWTTRPSAATLMGWLALCPSSSRN